MPFDLPTLIFVAALLSTCGGFAFALLWLIHPRVPGLGLLALAAALHSAGLFLVVVRPILPTFVAIIVANAVLLAGDVAMITGLSRFVGRPAPLRAAIALALAVIGALAWHLYIVDSFADRAIVISVASAIYLGFGGWLLAADAPAERRTAHYIVGVALGAGAAVFAVRALVLHVSPDIAGLPFSHPIHAVTFLVTILVTICYVFGIAVIVSRRLQSQLDRLSAGPGSAHRGAAAQLPARLEMELARTRRAGGRFATLIIDAAVTDTTAIERGVILSPALAALRRELGPSDTITRDDGGRYCAILAGGTLESAMALGERLLDATEMAAITDPQGPAPPRLAIGAIEVVGGVGSVDAVLAAGNRMIERSMRAPQAQVAGERLSAPTLRAQAAPAV